MLARSIARRAVSTAYTLPAPVGGWNARDPLADMDESEAVTLDNWFPQPAEVVLRKGFTNHVTTGISDTVDTLMTYATPTGVTLFAAAGATIYNVTTGDTAAVTSETSLTSDRWQWVNFRTAAGSSVLMAANGADSMRIYNGSAWAATSISGVTSSSIDNLFVHAERIWLVEEESTKAWYLGAGAVSGTATSFNLGAVFKLGGKLVAGGSWTIDAGEGMDDHCVFVSSKGEVAVYKGYDPSSASTFGLVGVYRLAPPIGKRCIVRYAGDLIVLTADGAFPLSRALQTDRNQGVAITDKIRRAFADAYGLYGSEFGWEGIHYPIAPFLLFNVPDTVNGSVQYAMNVLNGSWCRFTGMDANCWAVSGDSLYFASGTSIYKAWNGTADFGTDNIVGDCKQAFNYFRRRGQVKHVKMVRPILLADGDPAIGIGWSVDYGDEGPSSTPTFTSAGTALVWDSGAWDVDVWGGDPSVRRNWQTAGAIGTALALRMQATARGITVKWTATDVVYETGGIL